MQANVLDIRDPELKKQFDERLVEHKRQAAEEEKTRQQQTLKDAPCPRPTPQARRLLNGRPLPSPERVPPLRTSPSRKLH